MGLQKDAARRRKERLHRLAVPGVVGSPDNGPQSLVHLQHSALCIGDDRSAGQLVEEDHVPRYSRMAAATRPGLLMWAQCPETSSNFSVLWDRCA